MARVDDLSHVTRAEFEAFRGPRAGRSNPERMDNPFWDAMVRLRWDGYGAASHFGVEERARELGPTWSFQRFGMSRTLLPDDSIVFIAGEHEDSYDPDFAIYNDVVIRRWSGEIEVYGYPYADFEPTDFHSATLIGDSIWIIGSIGNPKDRIVGTTPVYWLDLNTMVIGRIEVKGEEPGWIHGHHAAFLRNENSIVIWGGKLLNTEDKLIENDQIWALSLREFSWRRVDPSNFSAVY